MSSLNKKITIMSEKEKEIEIENGDEAAVDNAAEASEKNASECECGSAVDSDSAKCADDSADKAEGEDPLEAANREIDELKDKYLRSVAEFDNYRKRTLKEKAELILNGGEKVISAILPVLDDMERAIANGEKAEDVAVLREGMELIYSKFQKTLEGLGVKRIVTDNADFDTDVHEAIAMVPSPDDDKKGKVLDCVQAGYMLNDKVIRHAKVAVGQ